MWICINCGQDIEDDFEVCWNCRFDKDGSPPSAPVQEERKFEIKETKYPFHWGAFFLAPLWLLFHGKARMGAFLLLLKVLGAGFGSVFALLSFVVVLFIALGYGSLGYKIAWETGNYDSFKEMKRQQMPWNIAGIVFGLIEVLFRIYAGLSSG